MSRTLPTRTLIASGGAALALALAAGGGVAHAQPASADVTADLTGSLNVAGVSEPYYVGSYDFVNGSDATLIAVPRVVVGSLDLPLYETLTLGAALAATAVVTGVVAGM